MQCQELVTILYGFIRMGIAVELPQFMKLKILPIRKLACHLELLVLLRSKHAGQPMKIVLT
jgi:hypothetical protein